MLLEQAVVRGFIWVHLLQKVEFQLFQLYHQQAVEEAVEKHRVLMDQQEDLEEQVRLVAHFSQEIHLR